MEINEIKQLFAGRAEFAVVGLTGRTGSGCTTAARVLEESLPVFPTYHDANVGEVSFFNKGFDGKRYNIVKNYAENNWDAFYSIKISDVISAYLLNIEETTLIDFIDRNKNSQRVNRNTIINLTKTGFYSKTLVKRQFEDIQLQILSHSKQKINISAERLAKFVAYLKIIRRFTNKFKNELNEIENGLYVSVYQAAGDSIRKLGKVKPNYMDKDFDPKSIYHLPETVNRIIKTIRLRNEKSFIVIDAIRNPYEAMFFKDRYAAFYLVSVNAPDADRKEYLKTVHKFTGDHLLSLDKKESGLETNKKQLTIKESKDPEEVRKYNLGRKQNILVGQNVKRCIEMSDIHLFNPRNELQNNNVLKAQLAWYISLIKHPGLISPTSMERVMQIAYTAKTNSGCISRQVGAVVVNEDESIRSIGWNDVADGQYPCSLRSVDGLLNEFDSKIYSVYERSNLEFRKKIGEKFTNLIPISNITEGRNIAYCFKDIKNSISEENNQVHTRSLHAEENAFLQIVKYGGQGVKGGKLYTTASPCELCAKKAYQLGIREIIYIDPYPGISNDHIISIGENPPELVQFRGAVGKAYHMLYEPVIPYKDELEYFL